MEPRAADEDFSGQELQRHETIVRFGFDLEGVWRRERDSNPRYGFPYTHFPGVLLQPLGHLSFDLPSKMNDRIGMQK